MRTKSPIETTVRIIRMMAELKTTREMAEELGLTERTVRRYIEKINAK